MNWKGKLKLFVMEGWGKQELPTRNWASDLNISNLLLRKKGEASR